MKTTENTRGRPSKLTDEKIELAIRLRERGFPIREIAQALGVTEQLLYLKNSEWEQLRNRLNVIKAKQEMERLGKVEKSLYNRAIGYKTKEKKEVFDAEGALQGFTITTKHIPADVKAQQLYLTNKDPENWKNNPEETTDAENSDDVLKVTIVDEPPKEDK